MDRQYRPAKGRANWAVFFLVLHGVIIIAYFVLPFATGSIGADYSRLGIMIIAYLQAASYFAAAVAFLRWVHLSSKNLAPLGVRNQQFSPGWAVDWWFIPIMNLLWPYLIMAEIWSGSRPQNQPEYPVVWVGSHALPLLGLWWTTFLLSGYIGNLTLRFFFSGDLTSARVVEGYVATVLIEAVSLVSLILAIILIRRITLAQAEKQAMLQHAAPGGVRYCPQCGAERASDAAMFCIVCGSQL